MVTGRSFGGRRGDLLAVDPDAAGLRPLEAGDQRQQRALAGAAGSDHGEELAALHLQIEIHLHVLVAEAKMFDLKRGHDRPPPAPDAMNNSRQSPSSTSAITAAASN